MSKRERDKDKDQEGGQAIPAVGEFTSSITETDLEMGGGKAPSMAELLGRKKLKSVSEPKVLLRLTEGALRPALAASLGLDAVQPPPRRPDELPIPLVLGPFELSTLRRIAADGGLRSQDCVLAGFGRWKPAREVFSDLVESTHTDEITNTMTATATVSRIDDEGTPGEGLELDAVEDVPRVARPERAPEADPDDVASLDLDDSDGAPPPMRNRENPKAAANIQTVKGFGGAAAHQKPIAPGSVKANVNKWIVAAVVVVAIIMLTNRRRSPGERSTVVPAKDMGMNVTPDWPANLKPLTREEYQAGEPPVIAKIRPVLSAYENGSLVMSPADEKLLREVADPASASLEGRRLAANQLAVFYLAASRLDEARNALAPILEASASDSVTQLNLSLLHLSHGEYGEARESASAALRLMHPANAWIAYSVLGLVEGSRGRVEIAEASYKDALRRSPNNPFIYGFYVRTLLERGQGLEKIASLMREALWGDPDRLMDSPIRAPLAAHVLLPFALEGLVKGAEYRDSRLTPGKKAFVRWLEARYRHNPLTQPIPRVTELLAKEDDMQSQVLYAFTLREQGKLEEAAEVLNRTIPLLEASGGEIKSSFPWSFAGDVHYTRRNVSQAILFYQNALSRNAQDIGAVHGMALAFRDSGEFKLAEQKLAEALSLDPGFMPSLLRITRAEWHAAQ